MNHLDDASRRARNLAEQRAVENCDNCDWVCVNDDDDWRCKHTLDECAVPTLSRWWYELYEWKCKEALLDLSVKWPGVWIPRPLKHTGTSRKRMTHWKRLRHELPKSTSSWSTRGDDHIRAARETWKGRNPGRGGHGG